jgi:hypothetical protein
MTAGDAELGLEDISWKGVDPEVSEQARNEGLVPAAFICKKLKISRRTLGRAVKSGEIEVARQIGKVRLFDPEDIDDATLEESLKNPDQKGFLIEYLLEAVEKQNDHIDKLVQISHKPAQDTIAALAAENESLRARVDAQWKTMAEVHDLYGTALKETMLMEVEANKERLQTKMKEDSFALLKDKLIPVVLENLSSTKFIKSFTDDQIEAFIEAGAATAEQTVLLRKELAKRKAAQQKTESKKPKGDNNGKAQSEKSTEGSGTDSSK